MKNHLFLQVKTVGSCPPILEFHVLGKIADFQLVRLAAVREAMKEAPLILLLIVARLTESGPILAEVRLIAQVSVEL